LRTTHHKTCRREERALIVEEGKSKKCQDKACGDIIELKLDVTFTHPGKESKEARGLVEQKKLDIQEGGVGVLTASMSLRVFFLKRKGRREEKREKRETFEIYNKVSHGLAT